MPRPHAAAIIEDAYHARLSDGLRQRGWRTRIVPHTGYGSVASIRVLGRLLMSRGQDPHSTQRSYNSHLRSIELDTRRWRAFVATPAVDAPVTVTLGNRVVESRTDRGGLIDVTIRGHGLGPGWHDVLVESPQAQPVRARVLVVGTTQPVGIISDIDDTVLSTSLPRPLLAAWNTFVKVEGTRPAVPGMATM